MQTLVFLYLKSVKINYIKLLLRVKQYSSEVNSVTMLVYIYFFKYFYIFIYIFY